MRKLTRSVVTLTLVLAILLAGTLVPAGPVFGQDQPTTPNTNYKPRLATVSNAAASSSAPDQGICTVIAELARWIEPSSPSGRILLPLILRAISTCTDANVGPYVGSIAVRRGADKIGMPITRGGTGRILGGELVPANTIGYSLSSSTSISLLHDLGAMTTVDATQWQLIGVFPLQPVSIINAATLLQEPQTPQEAEDLARAKEWERMERESQDPSIGGFEILSTDEVRVAPGTEFAATNMGSICPKPSTKAGIVTLYPRLQSVGPGLSKLTIWVKFTTDSNQWIECPALPLTPYQWIDFSTVWLRLPVELQQEIDGSLLLGGVFDPYDTTLQLEPVGGGDLQDVPAWAYPIVYGMGLYILYVTRGGAGMQTNVFMVVAEPTNELIAAQVITQP